MKREVYRNKTSEDLTYQLGNQRVEKRNMICGFEGRNRGYETTMMENQKSCMSKIEPWIILTPDSWVLLIIISKKD